MTQSPSPTLETRKWITPLLLILVSLLFVFAIKLYAPHNPYVERVIVILGINIILIVALNLSNGYTGIFSLGHVGFMAIGSYVSSILTLALETKATNLPDLPAWLAHVQLSFIPALLIAATIAAIIAFLIGIPLMRLSGHYVSVATLGFLVIVHIVLINWTQFTRGARTFSGVIQYTNIWWVYLWLIITIYIVWRVVHSPYGRALIAVREDTIAAQSMGINILQSRLLAFVVSAFLTAIGGGLMAHYLTSFSPATFYFTATFNYIIMLVVGGMGSISGSILGTTLVTLLSEILRNAELGVRIGSIKLPALYGLSQIVLSITFILIVILRRKGLMGDREINFSWINKIFTSPSKT
ncbi:MAG: branched-chain amino acid ABC transporter permease [Anaerolineales bacterium]